MAALKPSHAEAIERLRAYVPPPTHYFSLPLTRRAAVLLLLYADRNGKLRVVLTMRAKTLSSYAGQAALPGGRAEDLNESPSDTARREAFEEIGLPLSDDAFPAPIRIHHLCQLPMNLARTEVGVRPVVAWLETVPGPDGSPTLLAEDVLIPRLDAHEVAAVFTAPFEAFLSLSAGDDADDTTPGPGPAAAPGNSFSDFLEGPALTRVPSNDSDAGGGGSMLQDPGGERDDATAWYAGQWIEWHGSSWRMHNFYVSSASQRVAWAEPPATTMTMNRFRVFGMTARILVDAARVAFGRDPEFKHNTHLGDEDMIGELLRQGKLPEVVRRKRAEVVPLVADAEGEGKAEAASKM